MAKETHARPVDGVIVDSKSPCTPSSINFFNVGNFPFSVRGFIKSQVAPSKPIIKTLGVILLPLIFPHDKFVEAYVREDAKHACESESEREYAVAFRMKILRSITNASERILPTMSPKNQTSVFFAILLTVLILPDTLLLRI